MESLRVIQIGWAVGNIHSAAPTTNSIYVKPDNFKVTSEGTAKHGVTQAFVEEHGLPLMEALNVFLASAREAFTRGARLVAHQIEFDAGVIAAELQRCGLHEKLEFWDRAIRGGICTMDPSVQLDTRREWRRGCKGALLHRTTRTERLRALDGSEQC